MAVVTEPDVAEALKRLFRSQPSIKMGLGVSTVSTNVGGVATISLAVQTVPSFAVKMGTTSLTVTVFDKKQHKRDNLTTMYDIEVELELVKRLLYNLAQGILTDLGS